MVRQTLVFRSDYMKYPFIKEINNLWNIFADEDIVSNSEGIFLHEASRTIISSMEDGLGKRFTYNFIDNEGIISSNKEDNFILCCISGGKDSLAVVLYYLSLGYNVFLYTLKGINKGYPEEYKSAVALAKELNLPIYIDEVKLTGKKYYTEHPLKNQVIACFAIAYCLENGLTPHIAFGDYRKDTNIRSNWGVNWTDNFNLWEQFNLFIKCFVSNACVEIPFYEESQALSILSQNSDLVPFYQSCLMTVRDRGSLRQKNQKKYNVSILPNRCGSCYKCCLEYIYFCDQNKLDYNEGFYKHCLDVLKKKYSDYTSSSDTADLSTLQGVYKAYFGDSISRYLNAELWKESIGDKNFKKIKFTDDAVLLDKQKSNISLW